MKKIIRNQWQILNLVLVLSAILIAFRLLALSPLYQDDLIRKQTRIAVTQAAEENGWLLSGIKMNKVDGNNIEIHYRSHLRGRDQVDCFVLNSLTRKLKPCNEGA